MAIQDKAVALRMKKLGILIYDARLAARRTTEECAAAIGITQEKYLRLEEGKDSPSLPQLEILAYFLDVPIEHFWENKSLSEDDSLKRKLDTESILPIRQKMIGAAVRKMRDNARLSPAELADKVGLDESELRSIEDGEQPVSLSMLEKISSALKIQVTDFIDPSGPVGLWRAQIDSKSQMGSLSPELQEFVLKQINRPYLELAVHLSDLPSDKLRMIAEGILEITL